MSTIGALIVFVAFGLLLTFPVQMALAYLPGVMSATSTGGPILLSLIVAGVFGYHAYAAVYVGLRMFKRANSQVVFAIALLLMLVGQGANSIRLWNEEGGDWLLIFLGVVGAVATFVGAGAGVSASREDIERRELRR